MKLVEDKFICKDGSMQASDTNSSKYQSIIFWVRSQKALHVQKLQNGHLIYILIGLIGSSNIIPSSVTLPNLFSTAIPHNHVAKMVTSPLAVCVGGGYPFL